MSKKLLSTLDHKKTDDSDMRYLVQPRGPGKSWVFRFVTPPELIGIPNPWDGKPLGKEIKKGLGTRHLPEARRLRDIALGDIRRLEDSFSDGAAFSLASAVEWREAIAEAREKADIRSFWNPVSLPVHSSAQSPSCEFTFLAARARSVNLAANATSRVAFRYEESGRSRYAMFCHQLGADDRARRADRRAYHAKSPTSRCHAKTQSLE